MRFGGQTITLTNFEKVGDPDEDGNYELQEVSHSAPWCRHRPMSYQETVDADLDVATEWWRSTVPIHEYSAPVKAAIIGLQPMATIDVDGQTYQVNAGARTHPDMNGTPFKSTIISKKQTG